MSGEELARNLVWLHRAGETRRVGSLDDLKAWGRSGWLEAGDLVRLPGSPDWVRVEFVRGVGNLVRPRPSGGGGRGLTLFDGVKLGCGILLAFFVVATVLGLLGLGLR